MGSEPFVFPDFVPIHARAWVVKTMADSAARAESAESQLAEMAAVVEGMRGALDTATDFAEVWCPSVVDQDWYKHAIALCEPDSTPAPAILAERDRKIKAEEMDRCCRAICVMCDMGWPVDVVGGRWEHRDHSGSPAGACNAHGIREGFDGHDLDCDVRDHFIKGKPCNCPRGRAAALDRPERGVTEKGSGA